MTSPSHKNHPTTASLKTTRSSGRSLWKRCLAGALCLLVSGAIPANDREVTKPLDRLKQRSARQRWRELRGEWVPAPDVAPQTPQGDLPQPAVAPFSQPTITPPPVSDPTTEEPKVLAPVPIPESNTPEVDHHAFGQPSAPSVDPREPALPEGSVVEVILEPQVATPRVRTAILLPHWPFEDDLDLVPSSSSEAAVQADPAPPVATELFNPLPREEFPEASLPEVVPAPGQSVPPAPIQVAEVPAPEAPTPVASPAAPPAEDTTPRSAEDAPEQNPLAHLKSIKDIEPFFDYTPQGAESNTANKEPPQEPRLVLQGTLERNHSIIPVYWQASQVSHNPLYFEDSGLERSGHSFSEAVQPFVSVGKFGAQIVALPYSIALDPVWKRETPLGHYRPGECAPKRHLALPINGRAAVVAGAAYTGIIYLIP